MSKHTPGPWTVEDVGYGDIQENESRPMVTSPKGRIIADPGDDAAGRANARLIAAAPEMLAALKRIRDARDYHAEHGHYPTELLPRDQAFDDWAADIADTAIRKAEGK